MQQPADGEACARRVLESVAVGRSVGDALHWFVNHGSVYPHFDVCETAVERIVDEFVIGDRDRRSPTCCRCPPGWLRHDNVDPCRDGALGEQLAVDHLTSLGLRVLTRNWRCRYGELDVIAADDAARIVVFIEVKTRTGDKFGGVSQAVTPTKMRRLRRLAGLWLAAQHGSWAAVRIDVIGVRIGRSRAPEITHLEGVG